MPNLSRSQYSPYIAYTKLPIIIPITKPLPTPNNITVQSILPLGRRDSYSLLLVVGSIDGAFDFSHSLDSGFPHNSGLPK
ncbi:hypothetical protein HanRHA438_Chr11g0487471 [Helianthus annuus]|nr:hypothetical protein HanRHA438_Chr11g0487471 [Helianthus annuus]